MLCIAHKDAQRFDTQRSGDGIMKDMGWGVRRVPYTPEEVVTALKKGSEVENSRMGGQCYICGTAVNEFVGFDITLPTNFRYCICSVCLKKARE